RSVERTIRCHPCSRVTWPADECVERLWSDALHASMMRLHIHETAVEEIVAYMIIRLVRRLRSGLGLTTRSTKRPHQGADETVCHVFVTIAQEHRALPHSSTTKPGFCAHCARERDARPRDNARAVRAA